MIKTFLNVSILCLVLPLLSFEVNANDNPDIIGDMSVESLFSKHNEFQSNFNDYVINTSFDLKPLRGIDIFILFGTWCHDSQREVPRVLRILDELDVADEQIHLIGLDFKKNDPSNRGTDFNVTRTPTFVFLRDSVEIGRIIERPATSLENELSKILAVAIN